MSIKFSIAPWLEPLIDALWKNKSQIVKENKFEYPDFGGVPKEIVEQLGADIVDLLLDSPLYLLKGSNTKKSFARALCATITNGVVDVK